MKDKSWFHNFTDSYFSFVENERILVNKRNDIFILHTKWSTTCNESHKLQEHVWEIILSKKWLTTHSQFNTIMKLSAGVVSKTVTGPFSVQM
jgi:hypothetical protein